MKIRTNELFKLSIETAPRDVLIDITTALEPFPTDPDTRETQKVSRRGGCFDYVGFYRLRDRLAITRAVEKVVVDHDIAGNFDAERVTWQTDTTKHDLTLGGFELAPGETVADFEPEPEPGFKLVAVEPPKEIAALDLHSVSLVSDGEGNASLGVAGYATYADDDFVEATRSDTDAVRRAHRPQAAKVDK